MKKNVIRKSYYGLVSAAAIVGFLSALLGFTLKRVTEYFETALFAYIKEWPWLFLVVLSVGITLIYFIRTYLFRGKRNKGIVEIFHTLDHRKDELPWYKIPSHYVNGFLTVVFGGSTGIEVSTVVATAAIGASAHRRKGIANRYKTELIGAGVAAGITALFGSPVAGFLFAVEVISRKINKTIGLSYGVAVLIAWGFVHLVDGERLFDFRVAQWKMTAVPFMIVLSGLAGLLAVYFTKSVIYIKKRFASIRNNVIRVNVGAVLVGIAVFFLPGIYGDSYHAIYEFMVPGLITHHPWGFVITLWCFIMIKPIAASLTLGAGGDGGVFAPSLVTGAVLGILVAVLSNYFFRTDLIVLNFALIGAGAMLSAAIHAPLTALFLTCAMAEGGHQLFIPVCMGVFVSKAIAKYLCNYTVYTYQREQKRLLIDVNG